MDVSTLPPPLAVGGDLAGLRAQLVRRHLATEACPLPEPSPGITWIVAANGVFKRGVSAAHDLLIQVQAQAIAVPGLARLLPHARFVGRAGRLRIGRFLPLLLENARKAAAPVGEGYALLVRPIEKQYFVAVRAGRCCLLAPSLQQGTATTLRYVPPKADALLVDIHSHHQMPAFFSATDDRDDTGLSVSAVIGTIYTRPQIVVRLNVYGHRQIVPATLLFDELGPFHDGGRDAHADL
jgi:hypothetical protein